MIPTEKTQYLHDLLESVSLLYKSYGDDLLSFDFTKKWSEFIKLTPFESEDMVNKILI